MEGSGKSLDKPLDVLIDEFIRSQVTGRGLDDRTEKAYRLDLEHFHRWLEKEEIFGAGAFERAALASASQGTEALSAGSVDIETAPDLPASLMLGALPQAPVPGRIQATEDGADWEGKIEQYLRYLSKERRLRTSTILRKGRVFGYFLGYLAQQGALVGKYAPRTIELVQGSKERAAKASLLSKKEIDAFFQAIRRELEGLDNDFRRRVCLRDLVMMELLFYHGIQVSELLRLKVPDYDRTTGVLLVRKKRGQARSIFLYSRALRERMELWLAEHGHFEHGAEYGEHLFLSKFGRPLSMKMVINIFDKYRMMAGIEKAVTPKDLKGSMGEYARELLREACS